MGFDAKGTLNQATIVGRIGQDPELKYTASGTAVLTMSVATNEKFKATGHEEYTETTEWHRVVLWRKLAEVIAEYAKKGNRVMVVGKIKTRNWENQNGDKQYTTEIIADMCQLLGDKNSGGNGNGGTADKKKSELPPPPEGFGDDELPF